MKEYSGKCHCGSVKFTFQSEEEVEIWICNCSMCELLNYEHLFVRHEDFNLIIPDNNQSSDIVSTYQFGTRNAKHFFCKICGIKTYYQPRSHPEAYSINRKSVLNPPNIKKLVHFDGKNFEQNIDNAKTIENN
tara:strand:+ start:60 stop:458 length:399 start_codon:yes stop_codon:yes gene_type:complete